MPNGYRRGGAYTRGGRTYYRRGTKIKGRTALYATAIGGIAITAATGGALVGSPFLMAAGVFGALCYLAYTNRRALRPVGRKLQRWADKKAKTHPRKPTLIARVPPKVPAYQPRRAR